MVFAIGYFTALDIEQVAREKLVEETFLLTKNIFVQRTGIHKSLSYHREAGIRCHLV